ncbi:unnamed protein product [Cuscuta campestris]|uniref:Uncharacterized protein n=1 Tax=Cuscuta campestris TaxID=132261 RepID=A0A484MQN1_9ASTE|nr:unnamed protein product [Cuscuta campestris]
MKPIEFIPFRSLPLKTSKRNPDSDNAEPTGNHGQPSNILDHSHGDNSGNGDEVPIRPETPTNSILQPEAELDQPANPNQHNLRWFKDHPPQQVIGDIHGGHADDITQERAFIINALITRTKVNWAKHFFNSVSKHLGKPKQKYLCQGLYLGCILESLGVASEGKKYDARYWLYYLSSKGENRVSSTAEDEGSSDNVLIVSLKKSSKRKQVVSPSPSHEEPHTLAVVNLDEEEEVSAQGELQKKKKRRISSPSTSGNANPDDLLYYDWRAWKVGNSADQLVEWDQQLKNERIIKTCLGQPTNCYCEQILNEEWVWQKTNEDLQLEHLTTSLASEFELDDDYTAVYTPLFINSAAVQENAATPQQEQIQIAFEEELLQSLQFQVQEILTTTCEIYSQTGPEIPEKSTENLEQSPLLETTEEETHEEPSVEVQRSLEEAEEGAQIARMEASEPPVAIFEQQTEDEVRDSLSRDISNYGNEEMEEELVKTVRIDEEDAEQGEDAESLPLQLFHRIPSSNQVTNFQFHSSSASTLPDEIPESWTKKVQGLIESALESQHASFRQEIEKMETRHNQMLEKSEEMYCSNLKDISNSVDKTLEIISLLSLSALAVSSANQVVTQDYIRVLADNQKEAFKLFRHFGTFTAKHKLDVWEEDPEFLKLSKTKKNRRKGKEDGPALGTYCGGSVPFSENMNRLAKKKGGHVSLDEVIIHTKTKKHDGKTWVDPEHAELQAQFFELREEATQNGLQVTDEEIWYSLVEGHNAKNRVPGVGDYEREMRKMNPSSKPRRSSTSSRSTAEISALKEQNQRLQEQIDSLTSNLSLTIQEEIRKLYGGNLPRREAVGTIASHFTNDAQTQEKYNNLKRIKEECGVMQGIGDTAESSKRKKK